MGENTAIMLLLIASSIVSYGIRWIRSAQLLAFASLALPMVAVTGYAYGLPRFYGQMSMMTVTFGLPLGLAAAGLSANRSMLRAIFSPYITGRIARIQIALGYCVPFIAGFLIIRALNENSANDLFGIFVVAISWFIILLITVSSVIHERVDHARRHHERTLERSATQDSLTRLFNRRHFDLCFQAELQRSQRNGQPLSLIMIDIDHFKAVNDSGGHQTGDMILRAVAGTVKSHTRMTDTLGRLGGEEFGILLPDTDLESAAYVAESLRRVIESLHFDPWPGHDGRVTASFGCACRAMGEDGDELMRRADMALYAAKTEGRNRVSRARETSPDAGSTLLAGGNVGIEEGGWGE